MKLFSGRRGMRSKHFPARADIVVRRALVSHIAAFAVLTVSLVAPIGAARAVLGLVMSRLARRRP